MKSNLKRCIPILLLSIFAVCLLTACGHNAEPPPSREPAPVTAPGQEQEIDPGKEVLIYAQTTPMDGWNSFRRDVIDKFNRTHDDVQIVVKDYCYSATDDQGPERLLVEIGAGQVPDIIDLGGAISYQQLARKGYLEDLWPYIENDPDLGRDGVLEGPLKAAEADGGLYMLFGAVTLETLVGSAAVVGDRTSWTFQELQDAFANMPEGSTILRFDTSRESIAGMLTRYAVGSYVDWETGTCSFDSPSFRSMLEFIRMFPGSEELEPEVASLGDAWDAVIREGEARQRKGLQMLEDPGYLALDSLPVYDMTWGGRCAFIGYPVEDGSTGSMFRPVGATLGISSSCKNKEAAWEFVRNAMMSPPTEQTCIPLKRDKYELKRTTAMTVKAIVDFNRVTNEELTAPPLTEERVREFEDFFNSIDKIDIWDREMFFLIREICDPYFAGARTLDETVALLQNRVGLYVREQM